MRLHTYVGKEVTAKSLRPAGKRDPGNTKTHSEKTSSVCQDQNYLVRAAETSTCKTPDSQRRRLCSKRCLLSTSAKQAAPLHVLRWEDISGKPGFSFPCVQESDGCSRHTVGYEVPAKDLPTSERCTKTLLQIHCTLGPQPSALSDCSSKQ